MSSVFNFYGCRVVHVDPGQVVLGGKAVDRTDVLLEVELPADRNGRSQVCKLGVECWAKVAVKAATELRQGQRLEVASGVIGSRGWQDKYGKERFTPVLRMKEWKYPVDSQEVQDEMGF